MILHPYLVQQKDTLHDWSNEFKIGVAEFISMRFNYIIMSIQKYIFTVTQPVFAKQVIYLMFFNCEFDMCIEIHILKYFNIKRSVNIYNIISWSWISYNI